MPDRSLTYSRAGVAPGPPNPPAFIDLRKSSHCCSKLVQGETSVHDWLAARGGKLYLIGMIDDASSELLARFVRDDRRRMPLRSFS